MPKTPGSQRLKRQLWVQANTKPSGMGQKKVNPWKIPHSLATSDLHGSVENLREEPVGVQGLSPFPCLAQTASFPLAAILPAQPKDSAQAHRLSFPPDSVLDHHQHQKIGVLSLTELGWEYVLEVTPLKGQEGLKVLLMSFSIQRKPTKKEEECGSGAVGVIGVRRGASPTSCPPICASSYNPPLIFPSSLPLQIPLAIQITC